MIRKGLLKKEEKYEAITAEHSESCNVEMLELLHSSNPNRRPFAGDEEDLIIKLHALLGNRWSLIAGRLPGRTDGEVRNHWNSHLRKKLMSNGIDPENRRVCQSLPLHWQRSCRNSSSETASSVMDNIDQLQKYYEDSDASSRDSMLPDLNVDLNLSLASSSSKSNIIRKNSRDC